MSAQPHRVFLIEDNEGMRESLRMLLKVIDTIEFCGEASRGTEALQRIPEAHPELVLVDVSLPDMNGLDLVRQLRDEHPDVKILVISGHAEANFAEPALQAGARGFVQKGMAHQLREAMDAVFRGETYLSGS